MGIDVTAGLVGIGAVGDGVAVGEIGGTVGDAITVTVIGGACDGVGTSVVTPGEVARVLGSAGFTVDAPGIGSATVDKDAGATQAMIAIDNMKTNPESTKVLITLPSLYRFNLTTSAFPVKFSFHFTSLT